ncbi:MAG: hypothetical protein ACLGHT_04480 [Acidimicrobiia bacterium]
MPRTPLPLQATNVHEWLSFEDPEEDRTWVFDVTFLLSRWTCIFGRGCLGVLTGPAPEMVQGCCSYGAHLTDEDDVANVEARAAMLSADEWQFVKRGRSKKGIINRDDKTGEITTRLADGACIFLNRPGFANGAGCALHQAAIARGERPVDWKPNVCWQLPLRREDHTEDDGHVISTVRQWDRRHWGEGGFEFHWWCTDSPEAFVGQTPVYREMEVELVEMIGQEIYDLLKPELDARLKKRHLAHPALSS